MEKLLTVLDPQWRSKVIVCTSDGAVNVVGQISGWQTRVENAVEHPDFAKVHCGADPLNLVNGAAVFALGETRRNWLDKLHSVLKWLCQDCKFIEEIQSQSLYHKTSRGRP